MGESAGVSSMTPSRILAVVLAVYFKWRELIFVSDNKLFVLGCLFLGLLVGAGSAMSKTGGTLASCEVTRKDTATVVRAECGVLSVPVNRADLDAGKLDLSVVVLKARSDKPRPEPIFVIAGGPGGSSIDMLIDRPDVYRVLSKKRDLVFVDQRGTGRSHPLNCPIEESEAFTQNDELMRDLTARCLETLDADPRYFTTSQAIDDLDAVRIALGYEQINLLGYSYGTRVAQEYVRRYAPYTRAIAIDGVVFPGDLLGLEHAQNLTETVTQVIQECLANEPCHAAYPELHNSLSAYLDIDPAEVRKVAITHPMTGEQRRETIDRQAVDMAIRMLTYAPQTRALVPAMLTQAASGDWSTLGAQVVYIGEKLASSFATGMHNSVMCSEDVQFYPDELPDNNQMLIGTLDDGIKTMCEVWPLGFSDPKVHEPLVSDVPALVLSGELDPVTPPRYGEKVVNQFANGRHLIGKGLGHGVSVNDCFLDLTEIFFDTLELPVEDVDECVEIDWREPAFLGLGGPAL